MYPLLQRDGLSVQYFALQGMTLLLGWHLDSSDDQTEKANAGAASSTRSVRSIIDSFASNWLPALSVGGMAAIHFISAFGPDSQRYPDLKTILFTTYAFLHIVLVYICVYYYQFCVLPGVDNGALVLSLTGEGEKKKKK